jgi:hypothetical protein
MRVLVFLGMVLLITQLILKSVKNRAIWFTGRRFAVMNVVLASEVFPPVYNFRVAVNFVPPVCV